MLRVMNDSVSPSDRNEKNHTVNYLIPLREKQHNLKPPAFNPSNMPASPHLCCSKSIFSIPARALGEIKTNGNSCCIRQENVDSLQGELLVLEK